MSDKELKELEPRDKVIAIKEDGSIKTQGAWTSSPKIYTVRFVYQDSLVLFDSNIVFSNKTGEANTDITNREWFGCKLKPFTKIIKSDSTE